MRGATESTFTVARCLLFTWRTSLSVQACAGETDISSQHLIHLQKCGSHLHETEPRGLCPPPSSVARGASRWHCAAVCGTLPGRARRCMCLCGLTGWLHSCVRRSIWMPHFTLTLSLFFMVISVFQSQFCLKKMVLWSFKRSVTDKTLHGRNFSSLASMPPFILEIMTEFYPDSQHCNNRLWDKCDRDWWKA